MIRPATASPRDVVLFYPGRSLAAQVVEWVRRRDLYGLRMAWCERPTEIRAVMSAALTSVLDATEQPAVAMNALNSALLAVGPESMAIYTERAHSGLEVFVRVRGVVLLTGPMDEYRWAAFFQRAEDLAAATWVGRGPNAVTPLPPPLHHEEDTNPPNKT